MNRLVRRMSLPTLLAVAASLVLAAPSLAGTPPPSNPSLSLDKSGSNANCLVMVRVIAVDPCKQAHVGDTVTYTFTVQNTGNVALQNVTVTDIYCTPAFVGGDTNANGLLDLGETWTYSCDYVVDGTEGDPLVNDACANGDGTAGGAAPQSCDNDSIDVLHPDIEITKCAENVGPPPPPDRGAVCENAAHEGDEIQYTLSVTNPGDTPLGQLLVTDDRCDGGPVFQSGDTNTDNLLDPGETWIYTCSHVIAPADGDPVDNEACATGYDSASGSDMDCDTESVDVLHPAIEIDKSALVNGNCADRAADGAGRGISCDYAAGHVGETIDYYFQVHNTGDADLEYTISDALCDPGTLVKESEDARSLVGTLIGPGEFDYWTCTHLITQADLDALYADQVEGERLVNEGCVSAFDTLGGAANDCDTANTDILDPELTIEKSVFDPENCKTRDSRGNQCYTDMIEGVEEGDFLWYQIVLTNTGNVGVDYTIDDPNCTPALQGRTIVGFTGFIGEGATHYIYCYHDVTLEDPDPYVNTACVTGQDYTGFVTEEVCDDATADLVFNTVAGKVFEDLDADGVQEEGEPGIPERELRLTVDPAPRPERGDETVTLVTTTDANGNYLFDRVPDGDATLIQTVPEGWTCSYPSPCSYSFTVDQSAPSRVEAVTAKDFGNWTVGRIAGTAFTDSNGNGSRDSGEGPLIGFTYYADLNDNSALDAGEPNAKSAADGTFGLAGLNPGGYKVRQIDGTGYTCTAPNPCVAAATVVSRGTAAVTFGDSPPPAPAATPPDDLGGALPAGTASRRARLRLPSGCRRASFVARVTGPQIVRVVFSVDGRRVRTVSRRPFSVRIDPRSFRAGAHRVTARVSFEPGTGNRARTLRSTFLRCRAAAAPRFTG